MSLFNKKKKAVTIETKGRKFQCLVCTKDRFQTHAGKLGSMLTGMLNMEWADRPANCLICENCGFVHWFVPTPAQKGAVVKEVA